MDIGEIIQNRYQIQEILGQGSMGTTYKALDQQTQCPVAVKLLHFSRVQEWKVLEMFEREARVLQQLKHPRIPAYIDYFSIETPTDVQFCLIQEYIAGHTLQQLIDEDWRGTEEETLAILRQLIAILDYLHTLQPPVVHRDINPKNIILAPNRDVYLVDFGAVQDRIRTTFLGGSTIVGTYGYVPYEQFSGQAVPASDYYALGATLLYMLTHRHPTDFPTENLKPSFHKVLQASSKIVRVLDGLLELDVGKRIASPPQIEAILEELPVLQPVRVPKVFQPSGTKVKKIVKRRNHLRFQILEKDDTGLVKRFTGGVFSWFYFLTAGLCTVGVVFGIVEYLRVGMSVVTPLFLAGFAISCWIYGLKLLKENVVDKLKMIILDLTPQHIRLKAVSGTRSIRTDAVKKLGVSTRYLDNGQPQSVINFYPTLEMESVQIQAKLTQTERDQLVQEIQTYYANVLGKTLAVEEM